MSDNHPKSEPTAAEMKFYLALKKAYEKDGGLSEVEKKALSVVRSVLNQKGQASAEEIQETLSISLDMMSLSPRDLRAFASTLEGASSEDKMSFIKTARDRQQAQREKNAQEIELPNVPNIAKKSGLEL
jgi:hypothetical protein